jgi:hypothetical protein
MLCVLCWARKCSGKPNGMVCADGIAVGTATWMCQMAGAVPTAMPSAQEGRRPAAGRRCCDASGDVEAGPTAWPSAQKLDGGRVAGSGCLSEAAVPTAWPSAQQMGWANGRLGVVGPTTKGPTATVPTATSHRRATYCADGQTCADGEAGCAEATLCRRQGADGGRRHRRGPTARQAVPTAAGSRSVAATHMNVRRVHIDIHH